MIPTATSERPSSNGTRTDPVGIEPAKRRHRSLPLAVVAAVCMLVSIVAFVLAIALPVEAGSQITEADLVVAQVADDPTLSPIPLAEKSAVLGRTAAVDLQPGSLLVPSSLGEASIVGEGESLVGVEVPAAAAPIGSLRPGDQVQLVEVTTAGESRTADAPGVIAQGRVLRVATAESGTATTHLTVVVPSDAGPAVAAASAGQRIAVVVIP